MIGTTSIYMGWPYVYITSSINITQIALPRHWKWRNRYVVHCLHLATCLIEKNHMEGDTLSTVLLVHQVQLHVALPWGLFYPATPATPSNPQQPPVPGRQSKEPDPAPKCKGSAACQNSNSDPPKVANMGKNVEKSEYILFLSEQHVKICDKFVKFRRNALSDIQEDWNGIMKRNAFFPHK